MADNVALLVNSDGTLVIISPGKTLVQAFGKEPSREDLENLAVNTGLAWKRGLNKLPYNWVEASDRASIVLAPSDKPFADMIAAFEAGIQFLPDWAQTVCTASRFTAK